MKEENRFERVEALYRLFDKAVEDLNINLACKKGCGSCCTCNVVLTGLETAFLISNLDAAQQKALRQKLETANGSRHFVPKLTTNAFARHCIEDWPIPKEENDPSWGKCLLLENDLCSLYKSRPLGCRTMLSQINCETSGEAQIHPVAMTIANLCMQGLEHLDQNGISGNLSDILLLYLDSKNLSQEAIKTKALSDPEHRFVANEKIPVLMVPPEHRDRVTSFWKEMSKLI